MSRLKNSVSFIKICGICNLDDLKACQASKVNAFGILLADNDFVKPGSLRVTIATARQLVEAQENLISVLLIHTTDLDEIQSLYQRIQPRALQLQSELDVTAVTKLHLAMPEVLIFKTFKISEQTSSNDLLKKITSFIQASNIDAILLDSAKGGSGKTHNWDISAELVNYFNDTPTILAGGLSPENVGDAIEKVNCWGVDVMTGVSSEVKTRKSHEKIKHFSINAISRFKGVK